MFPVWLHIAVASLVTSSEACLNLEEKLFREFSRLLDRRFGGAQGEKVFRKKNSADSTDWRDGSFGSAGEKRGKGSKR